MSPACHPLVGSLLQRPVSGPGVCQWQKAAQARGRGSTSRFARKYLSCPEEQHAVFPSDPGGLGPGWPFPLSPVVALAGTLAPGVMPPRGPRYLTTPASRLIRRARSQRHIVQPGSGLLRTATAELLAASEPRASSSGPPGGRPLCGPRSQTIYSFWHVHPLKTSPLIHMDMSILVVSETLVHGAWSSTVFSALEGDPIGLPLPTQPPSRHSASLRT